MIYQQPLGHANNSLDNQLLGKQLLAITEGGAHKSHIEVSKEKLYVLYETFLLTPSENYKSINHPIGEKLGVITNETVVLCINLVWIVTGILDAFCCHPLPWPST